MDKVNKTSMAINDERLKQLQALFPEAFTEGKVDFDKLRQTLGEHVDSGPERYSFTWAGKREAMQAAQIPSRATLIPDIEQSVNFNETQNIFIEGDNLEVLKLLARPYFRRVKMIYIDPPYNTGKAKEFIYPDNYADPLDNYLRLTGQKNGNGDLLTTNTETNGRYHSAWLSMMYPRLQIARQVLCDDGFIFISIDENEIHNLRMMLNEIFGENNFVATLIWQKRRGGGNDSNFIAYDHEYILMIAKNKETLDKLFSSYDDIYLKRYTQEDNKGRYYWDTFKRKAGKQYYPITCPDGTILEYDINGNRISWLRSEERFRKDLDNGEIRFVKIEDSWSVQFKQRMPAGKKPRSLLLDKSVNSEGSAEILDLFKSNVFKTPKPVKLITHLLEIATEHDTNDIVLDFFAGSGTSAQAVIQLNREDAGNRRFILVQLPEKTEREDFTTISAIGRERIRRAIQKMQLEQDDKLGEYPDEDLGFRAFRLAETNYRPEPNSEGLSDQEYYKQMALWGDSLLVDNWDAMNVIYEVALKEGYGLNIRVEEVPIEGNTIYRVVDPDKEQAFHICLDDTFPLEITDELGLKKDDLFICHDNVLDDTLAANLSLRVRLQTL